MLAAGLLAEAAVPPGSGGRNPVERADSPYLVLVSIDGFSADYLSIYPTPALDRIAASGVRAESLRPVFPTLTFPNHYSIATGLYPSEHGIVSNRFPDETRGSWYKLSDRDSVEDGRWYGGEPIWVAAERHGLVPQPTISSAPKRRSRGCGPATGTVSTPRCRGATGWRGWRSGWHGPRKSGRA